MTFWFLPNFLSLPTACIRVSLVIVGERVSTAEMLASIFMSAPLVLYSSKMTNVSLSGMLVPLSISSWVDNLNTFHELSEQNEIPLNFLFTLNRLFLEIHGTICSFIGLLAKIAPASMILATLYWEGKSNTVFRNLSHKGSLPLYTSLTSNTFSMSMSNILPSVPAISKFSDRISFTYVGNKRQLSLVPEKPMQLSTLEWSQEEEVMELTN